MGPDQSNDPSLLRSTIAPAVVILLTVLAVDARLRLNDSEVSPSDSSHTDTAPENPGLEEGGQKYAIRDAPSGRLLRSPRRMPPGYITRDPNVRGVVETNPFGEASLPEKRRALDGLSDKELRKYIKTMGVSSESIEGMGREELEKIVRKDLSSHQSRVIEINLEDK